MRSLQKREPGWQRASCCFWASYSYSGSTAFLEENRVSRRGTGTISVVLNHDQWLVNHKMGFCLCSIQSFYWLCCSDSGLSLVLSFGKLWQEELLGCPLGWHEVHSIRLGIFCWKCSWARQHPLALIHLCSSRLQVCLGYISSPPFTRRTNIRIQKTSARRWWIWIMAFGGENSPGRLVVDRGFTVYPSFNPSVCRDTTK